MSYYRQQLEEWLKTIDIKANKVLDVGGSANPANKRLRSLDVKEYHFLDNNNELEYHNKWTHPQFLYDIQQSHCKEIKSLHGHSYDVIFCLEVFEYILNPYAAINNIKYLLNKGGTLYITFPFIYPLHQPVNSDCLRYTKTAVMKLLEGFTEVNITPRIDQSGKLIEFYQADGMRCAKGEQHNITGFLVKAIK